MKLKWDFKELTDFGKRIKDYHNFETYLMTATQNIAKVLHEYLLKNTPVDTGNLRKMWSANDNLLFTVEEVDGGYMVTFINEAVNKREIEDGVMYGYDVNYGHRTKGKWVKGRFFVEKSMVQTEPKMKKLIYNQLSDWFKDL